MAVRVAPSGPCRICGAAALRLPGAAALRPARRVPRPAIRSRRARSAGPGMSRWWGGGGRRGRCRRGAG
ncbi:hypothetical protein STAFG_2946 [Streptomyces afghaniensis 772]|uniref:Uncharacterized protein n=1 Tax=Streptomyces afghaniensis 772 TaxID=1283301 RepID=S4N0N4_9ACTN|nr:hypothetical protein STAFG_2946 [Streptomyces afghaniensis 772]